MRRNCIYQGDVLETLKTFPGESIDCIVTSPPYYGMRDYNTEGQIGLEESMEQYFERMLLITGELQRVLKKTGTMFWNHGDCYGGAIGAPNAPKLAGRAEYRIHSRKAIGRDKNLCLQNFRLIERMCDEQRWYLRNIIIWHKPDAMPSSARDRFTIDFEPLFFLTKSKFYYFNEQREPQKRLPNGKLAAGTGKRTNIKNMTEWARKAKVGSSWIPQERELPKGRKKRAVWTIPTHGFKGAHYATFPEKLIVTPILAGCPEFVCEWCGEPYGVCDCGAPLIKGIVLDPFMGSGTTALVALRNKRDFVGIELSPESHKIAEDRIELFRAAAA